MDVHTNQFRQNSYDRTEYGTTTLDLCSVYTLYPAGVGLDFPIDPMQTAQTAPTRSAENG